MRRPSSLFGRTAVTIAAAFILMQALVMAVIFFTVMRPIAQGSTSDLAALVVLVAQTWVELPPATRNDFREELVSSHGLWIDGATSPLPEGHQFPPYARLLEHALQERTGQPIRVHVLHDEETWLWTDIPAGGEFVRIGFPHRRIGVQPLLALSLALGIGTLLSLATALVLVRRLTRPIERLTKAVERVGEGQLPETLPEEGSDELATLSRSFNRMAHEVGELLENRTTLLAGISHDLRTPLTRLQLALDMHADNPRPELVARMTADLAEMNQLIAEFLEFAEGLQPEDRRAMDVAEIVAESVAKARMAGATVIHEDEQAPTAVAEGQPLALRRILDNLIANAVLYSGREVRVECRREADATSIRIMDKGPGIPSDQIVAVFRPFHRLESSRSSATGGTGLGLAIARQLAEANGWRIGLRNREEGGLEAWLELPAPR